MPAAPHILYLPDDNLWVVPAPAPPEPAERPTLDDDGLLRYGSRWVAIPDTQLGIAQLLVRNAGRLVHNTDVRRAYVASGGTGTDTSLRSAVHRLRRRMGELDLLLRVVRARGLILDLTSAMTPGPSRPDGAGRWTDDAQARRASPLAGSTVTPGAAVMVGLAGEGGSEHLLDVVGVEELDR